ncbi:MAG: ribosome maturation factor RimP [Calditrichaeota bacterium]|nr:MAG: ribosome maturation factor RimP [Calditrichota bacterium]
MSTKEKLLPIVETLCTERGLILVDLEVKGEKRRPVYMVFADTDDGITLKQCEELSRAIQDAIDLNDAFPVQYRIDVSSPGLDRPLVKDFQFRKNVGRKLKVKYHNGEWVETVSGTLTRFDENEIELADKKEKYLIRRPDIIEAKIKLQW